MLNLALSIVHIVLLIILLWYTNKHVRRMENHQKIIEEHIELLELRNES